MSASIAMHQQAAHSGGSGHATKGQAPGLGASTVAAGGNAASVATLHGPVRRSFGSCACGGGCPRCQSPRPPAAPLYRPGRLSASNPALPGELPASVRAVLSAPGHPLDGRTRGHMGSRFGFDFSAVRVHHDRPAAASARLLDAQAYTVGRDIVFAHNQFAPQAAAGAHLLGHELAHVIQQSRGGAPPSLLGGGLERDAEQAAAGLQIQTPITVHGASAPGLVRQPLPGNAKHLRDVIGLDPRNPQDRQLALELDAIEALLMVEQGLLAGPLAWTDARIVAKALELQKYSGGKLGGAVLAYYDRLAAKAVGAALAMATAPVVTSTDSAGKTSVLLRGFEAAQAPAKFQQEVLLGLLEGFAKAGLFAAAGMLAAELLMLAAVAAPAVVAIAGRSSLTLSESATALALKGAPRVMLWAARSPLVAEAAFTGGVAVALDMAETGSVNPLQVLFALAHVYGAPRGGGTPSSPPKLSAPQWKWAQRFVFKLQLYLGNAQIGAGQAVPIQGLGSQPAVTAVQPRSGAGMQQNRSATTATPAAPARAPDTAAQGAAAAVDKAAASRPGIVLGQRPVLVNPAGPGAAWDIPTVAQATATSPVRLAAVPGISAVEVQSLQALSPAAWNRVTAYARTNRNVYSVKGKVSEELYFASAASQARFNQAQATAAAMGLPADSVQMTQDVRGQTPSRTSGSGSGELGDGMFYAIHRGRLYVLGIVESKSPSNQGELGRKVTHGQSEHVGQPGWDFERLRELAVTVNGQTFQPNQVVVSRHSTHWVGVLPKGKALSARALAHLRTQLPGFATDNLEVGDDVLNELARMIIALHRNTPNDRGP